MRSDSPKTVTTAQKAAELLGGVLDGGFLSISEARIRGAVTLLHVVLDELSLDGLSAVGPLVIADCRVRTLRLTSAIVSQGLIIEDSEIGVLDIRSAPRTTISVVRTSIKRCVLHHCGRLSIQATSVSETAAISDVQHSLDLGRTDLGSLRITADGPAELANWSMVDVTVRDQIDARDVRAQTTRFQDVSTPRIQLRGMSTDQITLIDLSVEQLLDIHGLRPSTDQETHGSINGVFGSVSVITHRDASASIDLDETTIRGDLTAGGATRLSVTRGSSVNGTMRFVRTSVQPRVELQSGASVRAIESPASSVRSPKRAREVARDLLGGTGTTELRILHGSLSSRTDEQDMAYFALRQAEVAESTGIRKVGLWIRGQFFGWGVRFGPPIRVLLFGVLVTAVALFVNNPTDQRSANGRAFEATTGAMGLWFDVGSVTPEEFNGPGWELLAVVCTALGLGLVTVVIGVAIRRLTR